MPGRLRDLRITTLAVVTLGLAALALLTPFGHSEHPVSSVGWLLAIAAAIEGLHGLRRSTVDSRRQANNGAVISMMIALFLINAPYVASQALRFLVAAWFGLDLLRHAVAAVRHRRLEQRRLDLAAALGNATVVVLLLFARGWVLSWGVTIAGALRIAGVAWNIMVAPVYTATDANESVISELGLDHEPEAVAMAGEIEAAQQARAPIDRGWTLSFVAVLFAIHIGRMGTDRTLLGLISPGVAVLGDMFIAILVTLLVIDPVYLGWRKPTRWIERWAWRRHLQDMRTQGVTWTERATGAWLRWRLAFAIRMRACRFSVPATLLRGLQVGLPLAAILTATVPVWGMSWYFDTENWAAGIWNSWAASRTDTWREAMVRAVLTSEGGGASTTTFAVHPEGVDGDFSFIVIGDTGEGDASQHVLRDQLLAVANQQDLRFVVVSSDVVYPTGAMRDYEAKFWLPFKGVRVPVYAIPGNHDWYDANEAFNATFLTKNAARASIKARVETDLKVTSTTDDRIDELIATADRLRKFYRVPTGFQRASFFEMQTDRFALLAIDTGVLRTIDPAQGAWLDAALARASGKMTMAIVGHPFYAGGGDTTIDDEAFTALKDKLLRHGATIMMAGDTHDLEYYSTPGATPESTVHYFVNGGGGAYLSFGTALQWPAKLPTSQWAHYPTHDQVAAKIDALTPWWKRPAWWWTRKFGGWPTTAEWLSAMFDENVEPFFQSFIEVKVEPSAHRVRLIPYGVNGQLTLGDVATSVRLRPAGATDQTLLEWVVPMR
jgi:calcineurin-like phosphoesterase family protein